MDKWDDLLHELTSEEAHNVLAYLVGRFNDNEEFKEGFENYAKKKISQRKIQA